MSQHTNLGNISLPVGSYEHEGGKTKKRFRNIGVLMKTAEPDGSVRYWLRLNADILHASLYALVRAVGMDKGDDVVSAPVFPPRESSGKAAPANAEGEPAEEEIPF